MAKNTFTLYELQSLTPEEIIHKIQHENYSLLTSLGAENLRKEMVPIGKVCHLVTNYFYDAKAKKDPRAKIIKALQKLAPATYDKSKLPKDLDAGLVIGFNHPSLGEILRLILLDFETLDGKPMLFPINLPWYESVAPDYEKLKSLGIIITPTITPSTWKKLPLEDGSALYETTKKLKRAFRDIYTDLSHETIKNGGAILVAPSATRQATVFKTKAVYDKTEDIIPTMSVLALSLYQDPQMNCNFLPIAILPPENYSRKLNLFKPYKLLPAPVMTASDIRKTYFKTKNPKRLDNFDYDFHLRLAHELPKKFWY